MVVTVWFLVLFLNDEPVVPPLPYPDELIFQTQQECEDVRNDMRDIHDDDLRCIPVVMPKRISA